MFGLQDMPYQQRLDFGVLYGFLETNQTNEKKPAVWRNHTKAKGRKKPGQLPRQLTFFELTRVWMD